MFFVEFKRKKMIYSKNEAFYYKKSEKFLWNKITLQNEKKFIF